MEAFALETNLEIEEHVTKHNRFFKRTKFTLDDLDEYAEPLRDLARAVYDLSEGFIFITEERAIEIMRESVCKLKAIHAAMDLADSGQTKPEGDALMRLFKRQAEIMSKPSRTTK